jgi:hypothetical protein
MMSMPAEWWSPVVNNLALLQGGNVEVGFLVSSIDFSRSPAVVTCSWADGTTTTLHVDPDDDCAVIRQQFAEAGSGLPQPELDNSIFLGAGRRDGVAVPRTRVGAAGVGSLG